MRLTIYSSDFDKDEDVLNNGMSGKIFLENQDDGLEFKTVDEAFHHIIENHIDLDMIEYLYKTSNGVQSFKRFSVK